MNVVGVTGYLTQSAWRACTSSGAPKLLFDLWVSNELNEDVPWRCEVEQPEAISKSEAHLLPGRTVVVDAKLDGRPFIERGVNKGFVRFLRVKRLEFPRAPAAQPEEQHAQT